MWARPGRGANEFGYQRPALIIAHAFDGIGVRGQIEGAAVVGGITPGHAPAHCGQFVSLSLRHELRIDLVARGCVTVAHDEVAQLRLALRRQPLPGKPHRDELGLAAVFGKLRDDSTEASAGVFLNELSVCQSWLARAASACRWVSGTTEPSGARLLSRL